MFFFACHLMQRLILSLDITTCMQTVDRKAKGRGAVRHLKHSVSPPQARRCCFKYFCFCWRAHRRQRTKTMPDLDSWWCKNENTHGVVMSLCFVCLSLVLAGLFPLPLPLHFSFKILSQFKLPLITFKALHAPGLLYISHLFWSIFLQQGSSGLAAGCC